MRASELRVNPRRPGLAWAVGILDALGRFSVTTRRRSTTVDTPSDCRVWVKCDVDVGRALCSAIGRGYYVEHMREWRLAAKDIAPVLETVIPLMRSARAVKRAQVVLAVALTRRVGEGKKFGAQISDAVRASRIAAVEALQ